MDNHFVEMGGFYIINNERVFGRKIYVAPEKSDHIRKRFNNTDVYCTTFCYDGHSQDNSNLYGPMYIDFDYNIESDKDYQRIKRDVLLVIAGLESCYKIPSRCIKAFFSGNKGFHIIIPAEIFGIKPCKNLNLIYKFFADKLNKFTLFKTMDMRIYDNKRLFRLPNSINSKTGFYKVPVEIDFIRKSTYEEMLEYAKEPRYIEYNEVKLITQAKEKFKEVKKEFLNIDNKYSSASGDKRIKEIPLCILEVLKNGAQKGSRNNTAIVVASSLMQNGKSEEELHEILDKWNKEVNCPNLPDKEIMSVIKSAVREHSLGRHYGCNAIKDLGLCINGECKFKKAIIK